MFDPVTSTARAKVSGFPPPRLKACVDGVNTARAIKTRKCCMIMAISFSLGDQKGCAVSWSEGRGLSVVFDSSCKLHVCQIITCMLSCARNGHTDPTGNKRGDSAADESKGVGGSYWYEP